MRCVSKSELLRSDLRFGDSTTIPRRCFNCLLSWVNDFDNSAPPPLPLLIDNKQKNITEVMFFIYSAALLRFCILVAEIPLTIVARVLPISFWTEHRLAQFSIYMLSRNHSGPWFHLEVDGQENLTRVILFISKSDVKFGDPITIPCSSVLTKVLSWVNCFHNTQWISWNSKLLYLPLPPLIGKQEDMTAEVKFYISKLELRFCILLQAEIRHTIAL